MDVTATSPGAESAHSSDVETAAASPEPSADKVPSVSRRNLLKGVAAGGAATVLGGIARVAEAQDAAPHAVPPAMRPPASVVRHYWIQADSFERNLVPNGRDDFMGTTFTPDQTTYWAVGFRAYTENWGQLLPGDDNIGPNTGIPGPVIRGNVGDIINVHFRNNDTHYRFPHSIHFHGLRYSPRSDGAWAAFDPTADGTAVMPGRSFSYSLTVMPDSIGTWVYHDHSIPQTLTGGAPVMELGAELGLIGIIAVDDPRAPKADRENIIFLHDLYADDVPSLSQDYDCFNGYSYIGNTPTFTAKVGERVRWRIGALGREFHVFHIHGHRWLHHGEFTDTHIMGPSTTCTFDFVEDNPGRWYYHCHVTDHMMGGMVGQYLVTE